MKTDEVTDERFFLTGNRGHIFSDNEAHIAKKGFDPNTLCGIPMLFTNYYNGLTDKEKQVIGVCPECQEKYKKDTEQKG